MNKIGQRFEEIMNDNSLNYRTFAEVLGVSDVAVRNIIKGKSNPKFDLLSALVGKYPKINSHWLLTGKGEKYTTIKGHTLSNASVQELAEYVVGNQKIFLEDPLFNQFVEKLTYKRMWEIDKSDKQ
ncbi:helix-turn-helix domain-containing protein [Robiginitalea biformata]|uniref:HTH cro/C1-type domain-containing protein n=1 Tax=Robiginitalea biformata (strain ATCC BAA-864 / DSM 15991 / KCTC 12146 / HTCC2501) TaxID=313596 RepID=A4CPW9_ROBBH|nr:helix-turn-helix transcriptional regulator [Robiginitalea biformata]EAR14054.1 hypothetical protein RB2501_01470 [Robiginitalea biformata HTCC2501]